MQSSPPIFRCAYTSSSKRHEPQAPLKEFICIKFINFSVGSQVKVVVPRGIIASRSKCGLLVVLTESQLYVVFTDSFWPPDVWKSICLDVWCQGLSKDLILIRKADLPVIITENDADVVLRIVRFGSGDSVQDSRDLDFWAAKRTRFIDHRSLSNVLGLGTSRLQLEVTSSSFGKTFHPDTGPPARSNRNSNDRGSA